MPALQPKQRTHDAAVTLNRSSCGRLTAMASHSRAAAAIQRIGTHLHRRHGRHRKSLLSALTPNGASDDRSLAALTARLCAILKPNSQRNIHTRNRRLYSGGRRALSTYCCGLLSLYHYLKQRHADPALYTAVKYITRPDAVTKQFPIHRK
jgi:hypothetical protein